MGDISNKKKFANKILLRMSLTCIAAMLVTVGFTGCKKAEDVSELVSDNGGAVSETADTAKDVATTEETEPVASEPAETIPVSENEISENEAVDNEEAINAANELIMASETMGADWDYDTVLATYQEFAPDLFLPEEYMDAYPLILDDLGQRTEYTYEQITELYSKLGTMFDGSEEANMIYNFYDQIYVDESVARANDDYTFDVTYPGGEPITMLDVCVYAPYWIRTTFVYEDRECTIDAIVNAFSNVPRNESFLKEYDLNDYLSYRGEVPFMSTIDFMAFYYEDDFSDFENHELIFASPVYFNEDFGGCNYFTGHESTNFAVPYYDKTADLYFIAYFNSDGNLMSIEY